MPTVDEPVNSSSLYTWLLIAASYVFGSTARHPKTLPCMNRHPMSGQV
jgi:hypothetical protein